MGILVSVVGAGLVHLGFSEGCTSEMLAYLPVIVGGIVSYIGRVRMGDVTMLGIRK